VPTTWLSVLLFVVAIAPGLLYDLRSTSRLVRAKESAFHEIARITLASLFFSGFGVANAILAHRAWPAVFLNPDAALRGGWAYIRDNQVAALVSLGVVVGVSLFSAEVVSAIRTVQIHGWGKPWMRGKSAWSVAFKPRNVPAGAMIVANAYLSDGSLVRGKVTEFSADLEREDRELVLEQPISTRGPGATDKLERRATMGAVVLSGADVVRLQVQYYLDDAPPDETSGWRRRVDVAKKYAPIAGTAVAMVAGTLITNAWVGGLVGVVTGAVLTGTVFRNLQSETPLREIDTTPNTDESKDAGKKAEQAVIIARKVH
jgi:hypothetical protein